MKGGDKNMDEQPINATEVSEKAEELKELKDNTTTWELKAKNCSFRIKSSNACKLVDGFCNQKICPFNYWSN